MGTIIADDNMCHDAISLALKAKRWHQDGFNCTLTAADGNPAFSESLTSLSFSYTQVKLVCMYIYSI